MGLKGYPLLVLKRKYKIQRIYIHCSASDFGDDNSRRAVFRSVFAYVEPDKKPLLFQGECYGRIALEERGGHGFGYDPIFIPDGETRTFAEMGTSEKNKFSHRGKSLEKLIDFLKNNDKYSK